MARECSECNQWLCEHCLPSCTCGSRHLLNEDHSSECDVHGPGRDHCKTCGNVLDGAGWSDTGLEFETTFTQYSYDNGENVVRKSWGCSASPGERVRIDYAEWACEPSEGGSSEEEGWCADDVESEETFHGKRANRGTPPVMYLAERL